jgi:hypothetical protein
MHICHLWIKPETRQNVGIADDKRWGKEVGLKTDNLGTHTLRKTWGYQVEERVLQWNKYLPN